MPNPDLKYFFGTYIRHRFLEPFEQPVFKLSSIVSLSVCRALGIPCRTVTNYVSAHDTNSSLSVDKYYTEDGDEDTGAGGPNARQDSIWNFHVWNEVWMERKDLPPGHGGWQVIDGTPQEESDSNVK